MEDVVSDLLTVGAQLGHGLAKRTSGCLKKVTNTISESKEVKDVVKAAKGFAAHGVPTNAMAAGLINVFNAPRALGQQAFQFLPPGNPHKGLLDDDPTPDVCASLLTKVGKYLTGSKDDQNVVYKESQHRRAYLQLMDEYTFWVPDCLLGKKPPDNEESRGDDEEEEETIDGEPWEMI